VDFTVLVPPISCSILQGVFQCILVGCVLPVFIVIWIVGTLPT